MEIILCQSVLLDHVHILLKKRSTDRNEYVMKMIKGISSYRFFAQHPGNRYEYKKLWGRSYRAIEIKGNEQLQVTIAYIRGQKINGIDKGINSDWKPRRLVSGFQSQN